MKGKNIVPYTRYSKDQINAHRELIIEVGGERKARYLFEQLDEVIKIKDKFEVKSNMFITINSNEKFLKARKKKVSAEGYSLFNLNYKIISASGKEVVRSYFKTVVPSMIKDHIELILEALKSTLVVIENPKYTKLNNFKDQYIENINNLKDYLSQRAEFDSSKVEIDSEVSLLVSKWKIEYTNLKSYARAVFNGSEYDYRILFKDLSNSSSKSTEKRVEKDGESTKDDTE